VLDRNQDLFDRAVRHIPGGVNSPVRAFRSVGGTPRFFESGSGPRLTDVEGKSYLDYVGSWGPLIVGHAHPQVVAAVQEAAARGLSFGAPTAGEVDLADLLCELLPSLEMVRLVNSGTEATMSAIRLARGYTGRDLLIKFEGCYHGHSDSLLVKAGSGAATHGIAVSAGVTRSVVNDTIVVPYNDTRRFTETVAKQWRDIAGVIVEPVAANMGVVAPAPGFLEALRAVTARYGIVLIFDEVITGFRCAPGGAQEIYGVVPDITCLGKIIGGGLPIGAYGGRREIMDQVAPLGPVYQAGTLSGNPVSVQAGLAALNALARRDYRSLNDRADYLCHQLAAAARTRGSAITVNRVGSLFTVFCSGSPVTDFAGAGRSDTRAYARLFAALLRRGVYFPPSQFEACFLSLAHTAGDIESTLGAFSAAVTLTGVPGRAGVEKR
jgi:glutamate-1-semialdehyde 2,1-aminomutase